MEWSIPSELHALLTTYLQQRKSSFLIQFGQVLDNMAHFEKF